MRRRILVSRPFARRSLRHPLARRFCHGVPEAASNTKLRTLRLKLKIRETTATLTQCRAHLNFLSKSKHRGLVEEFFDEMVKSKRPLLDSISCNIMLNNVRGTDKVGRVIEVMHAKKIPVTTVTLNTCLKRSDPPDTIRLFGQLLHDHPSLKTDTSTWNTMLWKSFGDEQKMNWVLNKMPERLGKPDRETAEILINSRFQHGFPSLRRMLKIFPSAATEAKTLAIPPREGTDSTLAEMFPELTESEAFRLQHLFFKLGIPGSTLKPWSYVPKEDEEANRTPTVEDLNRCLAAASKIGKKPVCEAWDQFADHGIWPDNFSWNTVIQGVGRFMGHATALRFFHSAIKVVKPDEITFVAAITACAREGAVDQALKVFDQLKQTEGVGTNERHRNAVLSAAAKSMDPSRAFSLVELLFTSEGAQPDHVSYRTLLGACLQMAKAGQKEEACRHVSEILNKTPKVEGPELEMALEVYAASESLNAAEKLWESAATARTPRAASIFITLLGRSGHLDRSHEVFAGLTNPGLVEHNSLLSACAQAYDVRKAENVYDSLIAHPSLRPDVYTFNTLLEAHGRMCNVKAMELIMKEDMPRAMVLQNDVTQNLFLSACARAGEVARAFDYFEKSVCAGEVKLSNLTALLEVCAKHVPDRASEVEELFRRHGVTMDVRARTVLVDCMAKLGDLARAQAVFDEMDSPNQVSFHSLLDAISRAPDLPATDKLDRARSLVARMDTLGLEVTSGTFSPIFKMCEGNMDLLEGVRDELKARHLWGVHRVVATFWTKDGKQLKCANGRGYCGDNEEFLDFTDATEKMLREIHYEPNPEGVPVMYRNTASPDEIRESLSFHAEKKALAHLLLSETRRREEELHIVVDQRMCEDCRDVFARAATHYDRRILCRDGRRVHVFEPQLDAHPPSEVPLKPNTRPPAIPTRPPPIPREQTRRGAGQPPREQELYPWGAGQPGPPPGPLQKRPPPERPFTEPPRRPDKALPWAVA